MGICWYCTWGWSEQSVNIYKKYLDLLDGDDSVLHFGPGHIVWSDENFETEHIEFCLKEKWDNNKNFTEQQWNIALESLKELLAIPEDIRCCCPEDYDDENPLDYPPREGIVMIKKY